MFYWYGVSPLFILPYRLTFTHALGTICDPNVAKLEIMIFTLDKSRDEELENGISYTTVEGQLESHSALEVDKLETQILITWPLNVLVHLLKSSSMSTPIQHRSQPLKA
jgi:hypothetical protein